MNFCSNCGSDQIEWMIPEGDNHFRYCCKNCETIHYQNPKIVVGCIPQWEGKVLLCRRAIEPRKGFWNLPGGYMENGETLPEGAAREALEETNAKVKIGKLISIYTIPQINQVMLHFIAELENDKFSITTESEELKLFKLDEIPWEELAFHSNDFALKSYLEAIQQLDFKVRMGTLVK